MEWTDCEGARLDEFLPTVFAPGHAPEGWQNLTVLPPDPMGRPPLPYNDIGLELWKCQRIAWGTFERGPVYALVETHGNFDEPAVCHATGDATLRRILESIWFSDADLAAFAASAYNMTAYAATFGLDESLVGPAHMRTWSWAAPGFPMSSFLHPSLDHGQDLNLTGPSTYRLYWDNGPGVSYMDYRPTVTTDQADLLLLATGELAPPTMHGNAMAAQGLPNAFLSPQSVRQYDADVTADFARFRDNQCAAPY
jgi:hypothetical protein